MHTAAGNIVPPDGYLQEVTQAIREYGGLLILDEVLVSCSINVVIVCMLD